MYKHEVIELLHTKLDVAYSNFDYDKTCIIVCPGWGETIEVLSYSMKELEKLNRPIIVLEHPKQLQPMSNPTNYHDNQYQKARNIIGVVEHFNLHKVDLIAHSEGAVNGLIAASIKPDLFRSISMLNPAGIVKYKTSLMFVVNMIRKIVLDAKRSYKSTINWALFKHHLFTVKSHGFAGFRMLWHDINSSAQQPIVGLVASLARYGVFTTIIAGKEDVIFPSKKIKQYINTDKIDKYIEVDGWHDELHYNPVKYQKIIRDTLKEVDAIQKLDQEQ